MSTTFIKLSLLFQYLSIFEKGTFLRKFTISMAIIIGLWGAAFSFMAWFPCFPVKEYWDLFGSEGVCYAFGSKYAAPFAAMYECHAGMNMVFDIIVLVLPVPLYFSKDISRQTRNGLVGLFVMGVV